VSELSGLPALDTAVGMVFVFFLLSTACSMINESIANVLGWRAKTLEDAIRNLLGDAEVKRGWKEWFGRVHKQPTEGDHVARPEGDTVARVPADLTSALFDHWRIQALVRNPKSTIRRRRRPSYLPPPAFSLALAEKLAEGAPPADGDDGATDDTVWAQTDAEILARVNSTLNGLPEGQARELLRKAAVNAHGSLDGFRLQVERGFGDAMERASGWYKRKVQVVVVLLAAAIAIGLNVDSVGVATRLWHEGPVRAAVAAQAAQATDAAAAGKAAAQVEQLQLPVGWGANRPTHVYSAIPGWLITIAALSLGAPFWFDLLSRLARLRGSGVSERPRSLSDTAGTADAERGSTAARVAAAAAAGATKGAASGPTPSAPGADPQPEGGSRSGARHG
jgi:hypothetical protein